jgi:hypothetical protein
MKTLSIIALSIVSFLSCNQATEGNTETIKEKESKPVELVQASLTDTTFTFEDYETGKIPNGWSQYFTGKGESTEWKIIDDAGSKVLAQLSSDNPNYHFNEIVYNGFNLKNVELTVKLKGVAGKKDQGGGFVWRFTDKDNYYVVRANPLEDNVVLYKVKNGKRTDLPLVGQGRTYGVDVEKLGSGWNTLKLKVVDDLFTVYLNDKQIFQVKDNTFTNAGKVGLWTKADAVSNFDDFQVKEL